jgi:hypothetical protein
MRQTRVAIEGEQFFINGRPTYEGRVYRGRRIEGLLLNTRMVQGIFDDRNPETRPRWAYPDTGVWDPERHTDEFVAAMPSWRDHGVLAVTLNLQGGNPRGYSRDQPWHNSAFEADGSLRDDYLARLARILDRADELGMVAILGYFYFGQDERLADEAAVIRGTDNATNWVLERGYTNLLIEVNNECNVRRYEHPILQPERIHELIERVKESSTGKLEALPHGRLLVGTSYGGNAIPRPNVVGTSDFLLIHGNGVTDPNRIAQMVDETRAVEGYRPMPILFNEDDHFDFTRTDDSGEPFNNMWKAIDRYASWGYFEPGESNYVDGYQCPPVNWGINTERKKEFFEFAKEITGC